VPSDPLALLRFGMVADALESLMPARSCAPAGRWASPRSTPSYASNTAPVGWGKA